MKIIFEAKFRRILFSYLYSFRTVTDNQCTTGYGRKCSITYDIVCEANHNSYSNNKRWKRSPILGLIFGKQNGRSGHQRSYGGGRTKQSRKQSCRKVPRKSCQVVPKQICNPVSRQVPEKQCKNVPKQTCQSVPKQKCNPVSRQECQVIPRQSCQSVPKQV